MGQIDGISRRTDTVLVLLRYAGCVETQRFQNLVFLLEQETAYAEDNENAVGFEHNFCSTGVFSERLCRELGLLRKMDAITIEQTDTTEGLDTQATDVQSGGSLQLTEKGRKIAAGLTSTLDPRVDTEIQGFVRTYQSYSLDDLDEYVHREYGESASQSKPVRGVEKPADVCGEGEDRYVPEKYQLGVVVDWLIRNDIVYTTEGVVFSHPIDVLGTKYGSTVAVELKSRNIGKGIEQARRNCDYVDFSYLSVWEEDVTPTLVDRVEETPVGLLGIADEISLHSPATQTDKELCSRETIRETIDYDVRGHSPVQQ